MTDAVRTTGLTCERGSTCEPGSTWLHRARGLHNDERAQVLPLIFFLGIAFFTSVVLVINTGRSTNRRIKAQSAVDAAAVSGATSMARGMNYVASNNTTTAKLLASVAILRAFGPAIKAAKVVLKVWRAVGTTLQGMGAVPYVGPALVIAGNGIIWKVTQEERVLDAVQKVTDTLKDSWDNDGDGIAWKVMTGLHYLSVAIVYATPVIAQYTAYTINRRNIAPESGFAWLLPVYPALPVCQGTFGDYFDWTKYWSGVYAKPIYIAGWIVLTLSLFPIGYRIALNAELQALFKGGETGDVTIDDPDQQKMADLDKEIRKLEDEINALKAKKQKTIRELNGTGEFDPPGLRGEMGPNEQPRKGKEADIIESDNFKLYGTNPTTTEDHIVDKGRQIERKNDEIQAIRDRRAPPEGVDGQPPDDFDESLGDLDGESQDKETPKPWLLKGDEYPHSFLVFAFSQRTVEEPLVQVHFKRQMETAYSYASAMVYNPVAADMFCAEWRARLIRADLDNTKKPFSAFGKLPSGCGGEDADERSTPTSPGPSGGDPDAAASQDQSQSLLSDFLSLLSRH